ncbi:MAG: glycosyltransferase family 39 protein [archaeon]|nr:glycosyltransferase family 39 protein [archaeon]
MDKEAVKKWFSDRDNQLLFLLMAFTIVYRLFYFFKLGTQPIWWDEGDYLAIAKVWAFNQPTPEWMSHFTGLRPLIIPIILALMFKIGLTELVLRFFTLLLPSIITVYLVYAVGRDMYSKKVGLIAGLMMSVYWVFTFYTYRLLTDIPSVFFGILCLYYFWSVYIKQNKNYGLYLSVLFGVLAFSTRFPLALVLVSIAVYLFFIRKFSLLKDKAIWKAIVIGIFALSPYIIYFISTKFYLFKFYFGANAVSVHQAIQWNIIPMIFSFLDPVTQDPSAPLYYHIFGLVFILGILSLFNLILGFDIFLKQRDKKYNADFFLFLFLFIHLIFYIAIFRAANDRWLLMLMPPIFILSGKGLVWFYNLLKGYSKEIAIAVVLLLLFAGVYQNFNHANNLIEQKKTSYGEIKLAGEWLKQNTPTDVKIITASIVQNQYYSERDSYSIGVNGSGIEKCWDKMGMLSTEPYCQEETEKRFNERVKEIKPDYFIISVFEPYFTPQWAYTYPQRYNLTLIQGYSDAQGQPILILYKFN